MRVLSLAQVLGLKELPRNGFGWHEVLTVTGLPTRGLKAAASLLGIKEAALASHLGIKPVMLVARRKSKVLTPAESDRLYRLARALVLAANTMQSTAEAAKWLRAPNERLHQRPPLDWLLSTLGAEYVQTLLERMAPAEPEVPSENLDDEDDEPASEAGHA